MTRMLCLSVLVLASATPAFAQSTSCTSMFNAMLKEMSVPHHAVSTRNGAAAGETILAADGTNYVKINGAWRKSPMGRQEMLEQEQENIKDVTSSSCTLIGSDTVNGTPADVYSTHYDQKDMGVTEGKIWIAKATGLPLRTDLTLMAGEKTSTSSVFDYADIKAPVVK